MSIHKVNIQHPKFFHYFYPVWIQTRVRTESQGRKMNTDFGFHIKDMIFKEICNWY